VMDILHNKRAAPKQGAPSFLSFTNPLGYNFH
jgi:hypothetical protein